jgi:hypothetical protein
MVDRQARKVLKVHALSVAVILLSGLGLAVSEIALVGLG